MHCAFIFHNCPYHWWIARWGLNKNIKFQHYWRNSSLAGGWMEYSWFLYVLKSDTSIKYLNKSCDCQLLPKKGIIGYVKSVPPWGRVRHTCASNSIMLENLLTSTNQIAQIRSCDRSRIHVPDLGVTGVWPGKNSFHKRVKTWIILLFIWLHL